MSKEASRGAGLDKRPVVLEALGAAAAHGAGRLVVQRLDRFFGPPEPRKSSQIPQRARQDSNLRPTAPETENVVLSSTCTLLQTFASREVSRNPRVHPSQRFAPFSDPFAAPVLQENGPGRRGLTVIQGGRDRLLSVREVAGRMGLCRATVYEILEKGQLPHVRIAPADFEVFLAARRAKGMSVPVESDPVDCEPVENDPAEKGGQ